MKLRKTQYVINSRGEKKAIKLEDQLLTNIGVKLLLSEFQFSYFHFVQTNLTPNEKIPLPHQILS